MTPWEKVAAVVYFGTVAGSVVFVVGRLLSRFWKYAEGIALLLQHLMLVGFGAQAVYALTIGQDYPGRVGVSIVLLVGFGTSVWWLTILQERGRHRARAAQTPSPETRPPLEDHQLS